MTNGPNDAVERNRKVIYATCSVHGGPAGFTNVVLRTADGEIELEPHASGACVLRFAENEAAELAETVLEWLG